MQMTPIPPDSADIQETEIRIKKLSMCKQHQVQWLYDTANLPISPLSNSFVFPEWGVGARLDGKHRLWLFEIGHM